MAQEIERKFLVVDDSYKQEAYSQSRIVQGYICSAADVRCVFVSGAIRGILL